MAENFAAAQERRAFTRLALSRPIQVSQGKKRWQLQLLDISLTGLGVTTPDDWDADYAKPFNFLLELDDGQELAFFGHIVHMDPGHMGFEVGQLEAQPLAALAAMLAAHLGDALIKSELALLPSLQG
jgi:hypothetical protein